MAVGELDSGSWAGMTVMQRSPFAGTTERYEGTGWKRRWVPASARTRSGEVFHPHPFDKLRAGSNLPPSVGGMEGGMGLTVGEDGKILA